MIDKLISVFTRDKTKEAKLKPCSAGPYTKRLKCVDCGRLHKDEEVGCCRACGSLKPMEAVVARDIYVYGVSIFGMHSDRLCSQLADDPSAAENLLAELGYRLAAAGEPIKVKNK